jgi:N-acyl-D-amino-acid deacylase
MSIRHRWIGGVVLLCALVARGQDIPITGRADPRFAGFDEVVLGAMKEFGPTAGVLAIRQNGRIVYERGYGWVDEAKTTPTPSTAMCRIASLTKPITAAAVQMLIKKRKITPQTKPFAYLGLQPMDGATVDPRLKDITIKQLVMHQGGWDRDQGGDPTWKNWDIARELKLDRVPQPIETIRYMMGQPLQFSPGERRAYSNLGYMILGRVIEKASGETYYDFVEKRILTPRGMMKDVRRSKARREECDPREIFYGGEEMVRSAIEPASKQKVLKQYGGFVTEYRDAVGGWVFTAAAYTRFMDDFNTQGEPPVSGKFDEHGGSQAGVDAHALWRSNGMKIVLFLNRDIDKTSLTKKLNDAADAMSSPRRPAAAVR